MELNKIEVLLEKYFEGETTIAEEKELKDYFSSSNVATHLEQYRSLFGYFVEAKKEKLVNTISLQPKKQRTVWLSIAASVVVLISVGTFTYFNVNKVKENPELGTYDDPKEALEATQNALAMLSNHVNSGVEGIQYIRVYENTKNKIFVK
jgi:hypothetical protein